MGDADITLDKALKRALHIEAVTRIEEEYNEAWDSAIQSIENTLLVNLINDLLRTVQTNQSNRQGNQKFSSQRARPNKFCAEVSVVQEKLEIEIETKIAITEAPLIIDETITTVEAIANTRTEAEIGCTKVVPSSQRQR